MHNLLYVTQKELLVSLKTVVLGFSSQYYIWDPVLERFVQDDTGSNGRIGFVFIDGKDEIISDRYVICQRQGFLTDGISVSFRDF